MAHPRKRGKSWRIEIKLKGVRDSATRATKAEAVAWATAREAEILAGARGEIVPLTVAKGLERYALEVSPTKGGARWEIVRIGKFLRTLVFRDLQMSEVRSRDIALWRDDALASGLAPASVRRELNLLRSVFERAKKEWGAVAENPVRGVESPRSSPARTRRAPENELERILLAVGWGDEEQAVRPAQRVGIAVLWAVETAMRAGEIVGLTWDAVDVASRVATLPKTKNGDRREVPLTRRAVELHDLRAEALTRLARKVDVLTLARIAGHRDPRTLMVYYRETAADIAARLG